MTIERLSRRWSWRLEPPGAQLTDLVGGKRLQIRGDPVVLRRWLWALELGVDTGHGGVVQQDSSARRLVAELRSRGLLTSRAASIKPEDELYHRQIDFFDLFETPESTGRELNDRLQSSRVALIGLGGYGSWLALLLSRIGVRTIVAIDPDIVERSNLNRQVLYRESDVGRPKVDVVAERCREADAGVTVTTHRCAVEKPEDIVRLAGDVDLVMNSFAYQPNPWLTSIVVGCLDAKIPSLTFGGSWVGPLTVPSETACYGCLLDTPEVRPVLSAARADHLEHERPDAAAQGPPKRSSSHFAPRTAMTSAAAAWEAARFLSCADRAPTLDGLIVLDLVRYTGHAFVPVPRRADCRVCRHVV